MLERYKTYFREVAAEMKKVAWPGWNELWNSTKIVLFTMVALSVIVMIFGFIFKESVYWLIAKVKAIGL